MFAVLSVLITISLLTFGAVVPNSWLLLSILWISSVAIYVGVATIRRRRLSPSLVGLFLATVLLFGYADAKFSIGFVAALWSYAAARENPGGTLRFLRFLVVLGVLEAFLGFIQFFVSPGWILGYVSPLKVVSGTLINRNHFAGLMEMLVPPALGLAYIAIRRNEIARSYVHILAGAFMGIALFFSLSRMGIFAFLLTGLFLAILVRLRDSKRRMATAFMLGLLALVAAGAVWIGTDLVVARYFELASEDTVIKDARFFVFRDTLHMIALNPLGIGTGNYRDIFRQYQFYRPDFLFDHAHNDYLEVAAEWGIPIALVAWGALFYVLIREVRAFLSTRSAQECGVLLACIGGMFSIFLHSLTDFNLQIPSNAMLFFSFVGVGAAGSSASLRRKSL